MSIPVPSPIVACGASVPALIAHYADCWSTYTQSIDQAERSVEALRATERDLGGRHRTAWSWDPTGRAYRHQLARVVLEAVAAHARDVFCAGDDKILSEYTAREILNACGADRDDVPDVIGYWRALEARFGGGVGAAMARRRLAIDLRRILGMQLPSGRSTWRSEPKMVRGGVSFDLCLHPLEKEFSGRGYEIGFRGRESLNELYLALRTFLPDAGLEASFSALSGLRPPLKPPVRVQDQGMVWTLLAGGAKLWMPAETALSLRVALDEAAPLEAEAE